MLLPLAYEFGTLLAVLAVAAWAVAWIVGAIDVFRRRDLGIGGKLLWLLVLILLPIVGLLVYYLFAAARPPR
jgi:phospholipase D-like protein